MYRQVLAYGQSEYVRQFGIDVSSKPLSMTARVLQPPTLRYGTDSRQPTIVILYLFLSYIACSSDYSNRATVLGTCGLYLYLASLSS